MIASKLGFEGLVGVLLEYSAKVNHVSIRGFSALHHAAAEVHRSIVESLLQEGADPETRENSGLGTPILLATDRGHIDVVRLLIDRGVDINCQGNDHWTPLIVAAKNGNTAICEMLLERGANATLQTTYGQTALHLAAEMDHREIVRVLLQAGADPSTRDYRGYTAAYVTMLEGYTATADLLCSTSSLQTLASDDQVWPWHTLCELYGLCDTRKNGETTHTRDPLWYIDRSTIASIEPCPRLTTPAAEVSFGTWSGSRVVLVHPLTVAAQPRFVGKLMEQNFRREVSHLYPLRHPHLIRLYGACHRGDRLFLVMEHPQNGTLRSYVGENKHRMWANLHEVALGVQYLHERGFVHSSLAGHNILVGDDGLIKVSAFGLYSMSIVDDSSFLWMASEVVWGGDPQFESDVYSLGMCIIEAVSGETSYAHETTQGRDVRELIMSGQPPKKPATFSTEGWELVTKMICFEDERRLRISDVVRELAALAQDEAWKVRSSCSTSIPVGNNFDIERMFNFARSLVSKSNSPSNDQVTDTSQYQLFFRLYEVWQATQSLSFNYRSMLEPRLSDILSRFTNEIQAQTGMGQASMYAAQRQYADHLLSFHNEVDGLISQHKEVLRTMRSMPGVRVPTLFIPHYEVTFDQFQSFSRGAFGSVHHGQWMGAKVVIKKVFAEDDTEFEREVTIWSQLYHPHVLQLFGACHVGEKFLVSEFAAHGQLDKYLHGLEKHPAQHNQEVWRALYEAALGLQYLHTRGIVHCDLKCNNILIGRDGKAKVSDYGLSRRWLQRAESEFMSHGSQDNGTLSRGDGPVVQPAAKVGAPRWKAPEVLNGAEPTIESDVFSFGMCVVEAVTGEYPWGTDDRDELVSDHVRRGGGLFAKPRGFSDAQWGLVVGACEFDPADRLSLLDIVAQLEAFAEEARLCSSEGGLAKHHAFGEPEIEATWGESPNGLSEVGLDGSTVKTPLITNFEESW